VLDGELDPPRGRSNFWGKRKKVKIVSLTPSLRKGSFNRQQRYVAEGIIPLLPRSLQMGSAGKGVMGVHSAGEV